jgi:hypothetical protein
MSVEKPESSEHFIPQGTRPDLRIDLDAKIGDLTAGQIQSLLATYNPGSSNLVAAAPVAVVLVAAVAGAGKVIKDDVDFTKEKAAKDGKEQKDTKEGKDATDLKQNQDRKSETDRKTDKDQKDQKDGKDQPDSERRKHEKDSSDHKLEADAASRKQEADTKRDLDKATNDRQQKLYDDKPSKDNKDLADVPKSSTRTSSGALALMQAVVATASAGGAGGGIESMPPSTTLRELIAKIGLGGTTGSGGTAGTGGASTGGDKPSGGART